MASFSIVSCDHESARLYITGVSVGDYVRVFARLYADTSNISYDETITATNTSFYYTVDGLEADTDYAVNVGIATSSTGAGVTWWGGQKFTTEALPYPEVYIGLDDCGANYLELCFEIVAGVAGSYYVVYGCFETDEEWSTENDSVNLETGESDSIYATIEGLESETEYTFWCDLYCDDERTDAHTEAVYSTEVLISSFEIDEGSITHNSATVYAYNLPTDEGLYVRFYIKDASTGTEVAQEDPVVLITSSTMSFTFTGLSPSTQYAYNVGTTPYASGASTTWIVTGGDAFETTALSIVAWDWDVSNGPEYLATAAQTQQAHTAITTKGILSGFNHLVWNDMVYKANEIIESRNGSWVTKYGTLDQTLMTSTDKVMTAKRFNAVWWQCSQYINTGMGAAAGGYCPVATGDVVKGSYFIDLATAINNTIWTG